MAGKSVRIMSSHASETDTTYLYAVIGGLGNDGLYAGKEVRR